MDLATVIVSATSAFGVSIATAAWLSRTLISHRLEKDIEAFKSELERDRDSDKAEIDGRIRQQVETSLGDLAADREYGLDARKRLYTAIGPLRFQLLLACRDLAGRIQSYGLGRRYDVDLQGYFGRSTLFRILRPLSLAELVERQIAYADFAVDAGAIDLLRFKKNAFAAFSGGSLVEGHPDVVWSRQEQHVFFDYLGRSANALIVDADGQSERVVRFDEFDRMLEGNGAMERLSPFPKILTGFTPAAKPLLWVRLVVYGNLCNDFVNTAGTSIGFEVREYPVAELLSAAGKGTIADNIAEYVSRCRKLPESPL